MFPAFLLAKLYVKGSLKNTDTGFEFALKNIIDSTQLVSIGPITADDTTYTGKDITMAMPEKTINGADLSKENTIAVRMGIPMKINISGAQLAAGNHKIAVAATTSDIGMIKFEFNDKID
jgi:hypothetical protein